ncbi:MAG: division/cell wall cluster transcriptional repressor MraZ [Pseudomonadota bacterium]
MRDGFEGLYVFPSIHAPTVDAGGFALLNQIQSRLDGLETLTDEHDMMSTALYGASEIIKIDSEGRVMLTDTIRAITGIEKAVTFVGLGYKFQIWHPDHFVTHRAEAQKRAFGALARRKPGSDPA